MVWGGFGGKISIKVAKTIKIRTFLLEIVVFAGKKPPEAAFFGSLILAWLGLLGLPCLGLAWLVSQLGLPCLATTTAHPPLAGGGAPCRGCCCC